MLMANKYSLLYRLKNIVWYSLASIVIIVALGVSGLRFILTTADLYADEVEQLASSLLQQPVKIRQMDAKLSGIIPTLIFHDVQLLSAQTNKTLFSLSRVDVGLSFSDLIFQQKLTPVKMTIRGMNLHITRTAKGEIKIKGLDLTNLNQITENGNNSLLENWLNQRGEIGIEDSTIAWVDKQNGNVSWVFDDVKILLKNTHERYQLLLSSKLPEKMGNDIKIAVDFRGDIASPMSWDVKAFVESKNFNLSQIDKYINVTKFKVKDGIVDLKLWGGWKNKKFEHFSGRVNLSDFSYKVKNKKLVFVKYVGGVFDSGKDDKGNWKVSVDNFYYETNKERWEESKFSLAFKFNKNTIEDFYLNASHLKLGSISIFSINNHMLSPENEKIASHLNLQGDVYDFKISWKDNKLQNLEAEFKNIKISSWKDIPKIIDVSGKITYQKQRGEILLFSNKAVVGFTRYFRNDFIFSNLDAKINFSNSNNGILFELKSLNAKNTHFDFMSTATLWLPKNNSSPYLDLQTYISKGDLSKFPHYFPVNIMGESFVTWFVQGDIKGDLTNAIISFNGELNDFSFDNQERNFIVDFNASNIEMKYKNNWPKIVKGKVKGRLTGQSIKVYLISGYSEKNYIHDSYAEIKSFLHPELELNISAVGTLKTTMQYFINSPILSKAKNVIDSMRLKGEVIVDIKLDIPLNEVMSKKKHMTYDGTASLKSVSIFMLDDKVDVTELTGELSFNEKKIFSTNLVAKLFGINADMSVFSLAKNKGIKVTAKGKMKLGDILKRFNIPGAKNIYGLTYFQAGVTFPAQGTKNIYPVLTVKSNLYGIKSNLPDFLSKNKNTKQDVIFKTFFMGKSRTRFAIELVRKGSTVFEIVESSSGRTYLNKGALSISRNKAIFPKQNVFYIDGRVNKFTPSLWGKAFELRNTKDSQNFIVNPIIFNLSKLKILTMDKIKVKKNSFELKPNKIPRLEGIIKDFSINKINIGQVEFKTSKKEYGLSLDELILTTKNMKLVVNGRWQYENKSHMTNMDIILSSNNFGGMLTDFGYSAIIKQGVAIASGEINWLASPAQFSVAKLNGDIKLIIKDGNIVEADAKSGRLIGLFSLSALPRKLIGDFKDTFKSGFNFDLAHGDIKIELGDVYTENFQISSPVAAVFINGKIGLTARDFDNTIEVIPDVGSGIAGITALLINLPSGIGLWLLNKLTGEQLNKASSRTYEISGSWDKPTIELVEDE